MVLDNLVEKVWNGLKDSFPKILKSKLAYSLTAPALILGMCGCIEDKNRPPVFTQKPLPDIIVFEGETVLASVTATDPDGDPVTIKYSEPLTSTGGWITKMGDDGWYQIYVTASDNKGASTEGEFKVFVNPFTHPSSLNNNFPSLDYIPNCRAIEGDFIKVPVKVTDMDYDPVELTFSLPLNNKGEWQTNLTDAGVYPITVTANDGDGGIVTQRFTLEVLNKTDGVPILYHIDDLVVNQGNLVRVPVVAGDPDNDPLTITFGYPLDLNGEWQTTVNDVGVHNVTVTVDDFNDGSKSQTFTITVKDPKVYLTVYDMYESSPKMEIFSMNSNGSNFTNLTNNPQHDHNFSISSQGDKMVFCSFRTNLYSEELYIMDLHGTNLITRLTNNSMREQDPTISPDGEWIAYTCWGDILVIRKDGTENYDITLNTGLTESAAEFSPDGEKIYHMSNNDIVMSDSPYGWYKKNLTDDADAILEFKVSPNGKQIAYVGRTVEKGYDIFVMTRNGKHKTRITHDSDRENAITWSPDSNRIAFCNIINSNKDIYTIMPNGSGRMRVTTHPAQDQKPTWAPNSSKLIFESYRDNHGIWIMDAGGSNKEEIKSSSTNLYYQIAWK